MNIKAIIFDWGRTLFDSETKKEFQEAEKVLTYCEQQGYRMACASLVSIHANATLKERIQQIENSPLRHFFEFVLVTDQDKDKIFDEIVSKLEIPRSEILIVDDQIIRGIKYGNLREHPTAWLQKGKFANELPNEETKNPTFIIKSIEELKNII
jgi:FMN phosphatase YigB (HAD superfamily)